MEIEKVFRESVRAACSRSVQDIRFSPELEKRVYDQLAVRRGKRYRSLYIAGSMVACLVLALSIWGPTPTGIPENVGHIATALSGQKDKALVEKALHPLQQAIPELQSYQIEIKETTAYMIHVQLSKNDRELASATVNKQTGTLEVFKWLTGDNRETIPPKSVAVEKATAFLKAILGSGSERYQMVEVREIQRPQQGYLSLDIKGMNVVFKQIENKESNVSADISIWVDSSSRIVSYGHLNEAEKAMLMKLKKALPELKSESVLANKEATSFGSLLTLTDADKQGSTLLIGLEGRGDVLHFFEIESQQNRSDVLAEKPLALEKATLFLQQMMGDDWKQYRETGAFSFPVYMRYLKGLPVLEDNLDIVVDSKGHIVRYKKNAINYDLSQLPDPSIAIDREVAEGTLAQNMKLRYIERAVVKRNPHTQEVLQAQPMLDYTPAVGNMQMGEIRSLYWYIDAETGSIHYGLGNNGMDYDRRTTHEPIALKPAQSAVIHTKEDAAELLSKDWGVEVKGLPYHEGEQRDFQEKQQKVYQWETKDHKLLQVVTDAQTGRVTAVAIPRVDAQGRLSQQDAFKEAVRILEKYVDPGVTEVQISQVIEAGKATPVSSGSWEFEFFKSHEGVPVIEQYPNEAYIVRVDPSTGKAIGFFSRTGMKEKGALPDKSKAVSAEKALQEYLRYLPLQLAYTIEGVEGEKLTAPKLIYVPISDRKYANQYIHIDAITGKAVIR